MSYSVSATRAITITGLTYTYANRTAPALRDVDLAFQAGAVTLVVGKSGSGKTTLIRCINGLIPHSYKNGTLAGEIRCFGQPATGLSLAQLSRRVGTVMQDPDKQIVATRVLNEIAFGLENIGLPREEIAARVRRVARQLRIEHLLDRDTHSLSGGEQQKVVIAATLAMQPQALLLDEPLASLDPPSARAALALFRRLADEGIAVVLIEHRVDEALHIEPEQCVALSSGVVVFDGDTHGYRSWRGSGRDAEDGAIWDRHSAPAADGEPLLSFYDVHFAYPGSPQEQLYGVSFEVRAGEVVALIGPNGAGKSTLCKTAIGLLRPVQGQVIVDGEDAARLTVAQIARKVGYVFQNPAAMLFANTLREELSFGPLNVGLSRSEIQADIARAMDVVGLGGISLDQSPFGLSFGQQKRAAVASVLTMRPRLLILDEPTAGLDDGTAEDLMRRLLAAEHGPQALVLVTHDLKLARRFANRVILMAAGRVVADGPPQDVLTEASLARVGFDGAWTSLDEPARLSAEAPG